MNTIFGKVLEIGQIKEITETFKVQECYLDCTRFDQNTGEPRPNTIKVQINPSRIDLNAYPIGTRIKASFNIKGYVYDKKDESGNIKVDVNGNPEKGHYQHIDVFKIEPVQEYNQAPTPPTEQAPQGNAQFGSTNPQPQQETQNDLLF